jgi:hypothetical protein
MQCAIAWCENGVHTDPCSQVELTQVHGHPLVDIHANVAMKQCSYTHHGTRTLADTALTPRRQ